MSKTWETLRSEIHGDMNTEGEAFVTDAELLVWANDAVDEVEKIIVDMYDKYLETEDYLAITSGTSEYDLPSDIYARKITGLQYNNGNHKYEIKPIKRKEEILHVNPGDDYRFRIINKSTGVKLKLYPTPSETASEFVTIYYIRSSTDILDDTDTLDLPLSEAYVKQYIKDRIKEKEMGPMNFNWPSDNLVKEGKHLITSLQRMIPDDHSDEVEPDFEYYEDLSTDVWEY
mgnify:CR=1 FL=1